MTYTKLDISLLSCPPHLRGVAITLKPQFAPPSVWERCVALVCPMMRWVWAAMVKEKSGV